MIKARLTLPDGRVLTRLWNANTLRLHHLLDGYERLGVTCEILSYMPTRGA